ncbi:MAG: glycosyltransferase [Chitinophagales bacterium]|nr:glycosyltransferase [Chitinophagaceae bacterium]MCB9065337.1 glycosyltransferase [Chitinophagales bacterium]
MDIAIIGPAHPLRGGLATYDERLANEIQNHGHKATIYSYSLQYPSFLFPGTTQYTDEPAPDNLTIHTIINSVNPLNWISCGKRIRKAKHDLIIVRYWLPFMGPALGTILRSVKKNKHTRILCIADNIIPHEKRPGDKPFTSYFLKPLDSFITMSKDVLKDLRTLTDKPARFSAHPLYDNFSPAISKQDACEKIGLKSDKKYLLFFGFIRKYKGLDIMLEVMNDERIRQAGIKLIIAGEFYEDRKPYDDIIAQHNLKDSIEEFTEFIPNSEVHYYFSAADVVVQPYKTATQSGITQVAYYFEKPMIVSNVGGLPEVVKDGSTGFVAEPNAKEIADAILKFYEPNSIPNLSENLKTEKSKYSWDTFLNNLLDTAFPKSE